MKTRNQIRQRKLIEQRLMGLALILVAFVMALVARNGATFQDCDATASVILAPIGFWLFFTKSVVIY